MQNVSFSQRLSYDVTPLDLPTCIALVEARQSTIPL